MWAVHCQNCGLLDEKGRLELAETVRDRHNQSDNNCMARVHRIREMKTYKADGKGRIYIGPEISGETVKAIIIDGGDG